MINTVQILIQDERLHPLFKKVDANCAVQLWLLQIIKSGKLETRLLYGHILPYNFSNEKWSAPNEDGFKSFDGYKAQIIRINLYCKSSKIGELITSLSNEKNILSISSDLNFEMSTPLQSRFGEFCIKGAICKPVSYLPMRDDFYSIGLKSPHSSAGAFSGGLIPIYKNELFYIDGEINEELFKYAIAQIDDDTGMSFGKADSDRLGDLELLVFPTLDAQERNLLSVGWKEKGRILNVSLKQGNHRHYDTFFIKTDFINNHQVIHSNLLTLNPLPEGLISADFELPDYLKEIIDGCRIEAHAQAYNAQNAILFCQYSAGYVREISISGQILSSSISGRIKSDWLTKATKLPADHERIQYAQSINQGTSGFSSVIGKRQADAWVSINRNIKALLEDVQPAPSEGRFFECYKDGVGLGRLEFVEWIKKLLNSHQNHQIIIFDPYFEDVGISLLVPNAGANGDYIVFTTSESTIEQQRLNNLVAVCEKLLPLVKRIHLKVYALPTKAFHDRYILISDKAGASLKGFHLSNSIQKANENFPLLITPIPSDVLKKVNEYALNVYKSCNNPSEKNVGDELSLAPFFDSKALQSKNDTRHRYEPLLFLEKEKAGEILAAWTANQELTGLSSQPLKNKLNELGFLQGESLKGDKFTDSTALYKFLSKIEKASFDSYWSVAGEVFAHTPAGNLLASDAMFNEAILCESLLNYLKASISGKVSEDFDSLEAFSYCQGLSKPMREILLYIRTSHFCHATKFSGVSYSEYYVIKILWHHNADALLDTFEEAFKPISSNNEYQQEQGKVYCILAQAISEIALNVEFGLTEAQINRLIGRNNNFLKWLGYCALESAIKKEDHLLSIIANVPEAEKIMLLGWMINRLASRETKQIPLFGKLVNEYISIFPSALSKDNTIVLIDSLRGRMKELGWCEPWLFNEIIQPLINIRVNTDDIAEIWLTELDSLFEKLLSNTSGLFNFAQEGRTTNIAAYLFANSSTEYQEKSLKKLDDRLTKLRRDITKPLSSTSNWKRWDSSLKVTFWIYGLSKWIKHYFPLQTEIPASISNLFDKAYELSMYRPISEWEAASYPGGEFSIFLKSNEEFFQLQRDKVAG